MTKTETRGGAEVVVCESCGRFCAASGGVIAHATYCDGGKRTERISAVSAVAPSAVAEIGVSVPLNAVGNGAAEDEFHAVHSCNAKDWDRAMNRDD
jgi:hypothetical protein